MPEASGAQRKPEYIPESDENDVLFERLNYLVDFHGTGVFHGPCEECRAMMVIRNLLLKPFTESK